MKTLEGHSDSVRALAVYKDTIIGGSKDHTHQSGPHSPHDHSLETIHVQLIHRLADLIVRDRLHLVFKAIDRLQRFVLQECDSFIIESYDFDMIVFFVGEKEVDTVWDINPRSGSM